MTVLLARFHRSSRPYPMTVESYHELSTRLAISTDLLHGSQQPSQRSPSWLVGRLHSRLAELESLLRSR